MSIICPTVTAYNAHQYREQITRLEGFAKRIHLDLMDGVFTETKSVGFSQIFWNDVFDQVDIHLMFDDPGKHIQQVLECQPDLVIIHVESGGDLLELVEEIKSKEVKVGVSLLQKSKVEDYQELIAAVDHVLIFSGALGSFGGQVDFRLLEKVDQIKKINPSLEIGWDGGVNDQNVAELIEGGIDVLNVGGFIQRSEDPLEAFEKLNKQLL